MASLTRATYNYYYQIQQEAFVVVRNWFDFVARRSNKELFQQQICYYGIVEREIRAPLELL